MKGYCFVILGLRRSQNSVLTEKMLKLTLQIQHCNICGPGLSKIKEPCSMLLMFEPQLFLEYLLVDLFNLDIPILVMKTVHV